MLKKAALLALSVIAIGAQAATVTVTSTIDKVNTNWTNAFTLGQFDSALGTLTSVTLNYGGTVDSFFDAESRDSAPSTISLTAGADLAFGIPLSKTLSINGTATRELTAFDGTIDFAGTSGFTGVEVTGSDGGSVTLTSDLGSFIGAGTYKIGVAATGDSVATASGNAISSITTQAGANIEVVYTYETPNPVPEPGSMALVGLALAGLGLTARRRAAK